MSMRQKMISGVFFTALAKYSNVVISLFVTAVLSRILAPEQFGLIAVVMVVVAFLTVFADVGITQAVVQYRSLTAKQLGILFSITGYIALVLSVILVAIAPFVSDYYDNPSLCELCFLLTIQLFFSTVSIVPNALFYRDQLFKFIALRSFAIQVVGGIVSIFVALYTGSIYALTINPILSSFLVFIICIVKYPQRFYWKFSLREVSEVFEYSLYQYLFNLINFLSRNADTLLIAKGIGIVALGYYDKAYRLMSLPLQNITQVITPVLHPVLSTHSADKGYLLKANEFITRILSLIGFPLSVFLCFTSEEVIYLFFGDQWGSAVAVFQILSLSVGIQVVLSSSGSLFQASGDTRSLFICGLFSSVLNLSGIVVGVFYFRTIESVAMLLVLTFGINFIQAYWMLYQKVFEISCLRFFKTLLSPVLYSVFLAIVYQVTANYYPEEAHLFNFLCKACIYLVAFLALIIFGGYKKDILALWKRDINI